MSVRLKEYSHAARLLKRFLYITLFLFCMNIGSSTALGADTPGLDGAASGAVRILAASEDSISSGSGFGVGTVGQETDIFVTNWHVIWDAEREKVCDEIYILLSDDAFVLTELYSPDGTLLESAVSAADMAKMIRCEVLYTTTGYPDIAILQAARTVPGRTALPLLPAESVSRSSTVYTVGYPSSADNMTGTEYYQDSDGNLVIEQPLYASVEESIISDGIVSKFTQFAPAENTWVIQHNAHINNGNSGGPLLTPDGAVIGINTYGTGEDNSEYSMSVYVDYAMVALDGLGIPYDVYSGAGPKSESDGSLALLVIIFCAVVVCAVIVLLAKMRKTVSSPPAPAPPPPSSPPTQPQLPPPMRLQGVSGAFSGRRFEINARLRIGRDPARNELVYPKEAPGISAVHCMLTMEGDVLYLRDLGSTYGTYHNGRKLNPNETVQLRLGDRLSLGRENESFQIVLSSRANPRQPVGL